MTWNGSNTAQMREHTKRRRAVSVVRELHGPHFYSRLCRRSFPSLACSRAGSSRLLVRSQRRMCCVIMSAAAATESDPASSSGLASNVRYAPHHPTRC